jgi:transposase
MTEQIEAIARRLVLKQKRDGRSVYDPTAKAELLRLAREPGMSLAKIARACGMNANVLSSWIRQAERGESTASAAARQVIDVATPAFVPVAIEANTATPPATPTRSPTLSIQAWLPNGVVVEMSGCELRQARELVDVLGRMRCSDSTKD